MIRFTGNMNSPNRLPSQRSPKIPRHPRSAFTLLEMVTALGVSTLLLVAMTSVISLSAKTLTIHDSQAAQTCESFELGAQIGGDLKQATRFTEKENDSVQFSVPDRDGDGVSELIRYELVGSNLFKTVDFSSTTNEQAEIIRDDIDSLSFSYELVDEGAPLDTSQVSNTLELLFAQDDEPSNSSPKLLMPIAGNYFPSISEASRTLLFEYWGFDVTHVSQNSASLGTHFSSGDYDLVYLTSEIDPKLVESHVQGSSLGIANEHPTLAQTLGLGVMVAQTNQEDIGFRSSNTHYINATIQPGAIEVFETPQTTMGIDPSQQAPDLTTVVNWNDSVAVGALQFGDEVYPSSGTMQEVGHDWEAGTTTSPSSFDSHQIATLVSIPAESKLLNVRARVTTKNASQFRLGVYDDDGGEPGALIGQTNIVSLGDGVSQWVGAPLEQQVTVAAGNYWLVLAIDGDSSFQFNVSAGQSRYLNPGYDPVSAGLTDSWTGTDQSNTNAVLMKAEFQEIEYSAGRRVQVPNWPSDYDTNSHTDHTDTILKRSLQWLSDNTPGDGGVAVDIDNTNSKTDVVSAGQAPTNATGWSIRRTVVRLRRNETNPTGSVQFSLYEADINGQPIGTPLAKTAQIPNTNISKKWIWYEIPFQPTAWVSPNSNVCLVIDGASTDPDIQVMTDNIASQSLSRIYVYGLFQTDGEAQW